MTINYSSYSGRTRKTQHLRETSPCYDHKHSSNERSARAEKSFRQQKRSSLLASSTADYYSAPINNGIKSLWRTCFFWSHVWHYFPSLSYCFYSIFILHHMLIDSKTCSNFFKLKSPNSESRYLAKLSLSMRPVSCTQLARVQFGHRS